MYRPILGVCVALAAAFSLFPATISYAGRSSEEAKAYIERAVAHIHDVGRDQAFADFSRPDGGYVDGELYVFCYAFDGTSVAHGANPSFVGKNLIGLKDPDGKQVNVEIIRLAKEQGQGWIDFRWPNPLTKKIEAKSAYIMRVDEANVCGVGYYKG